MSAGNGATVNIEDSVITGTTIDGLQIGNGSSARVVGNEISTDSEVAIAIFQNSHATLRNNLVSSSDPADSALFLDGGSVRLDGGNTLSSDSSFAGFTIRNGSYLRQRTNLGDGPDVLIGQFRVESQSFASFSRAELRGDVRVENHGELELRADGPGLVQLNGRIEVSGDSLLLFRSAGADVIGDVICGDAESSLSDISGTTVISGIVDCTGFD